MLIIINKPFDVGDKVDVGGGIQGRVEELNIFSTQIRTPEGLSKIVPNNTIWNGVIVNETTGIVTPSSSAAAKLGLVLAMLARRLIAASLKAQHIHGDFT